MKKTLFTLKNMVIRNIKLYSRDFVTMFFSLLSSVIILVLFILFLKDVQIDATKLFLEGFKVSAAEKYIHGVVNGWFLSGVLAVSIISVGLSFYCVMIRDREQGISADFWSSPVSKNLIKLSYLISSVFINIIFNLIILAIGLVYLAITGTFFISFVDILMIIVNIIISSFSACLVMLLISSMFTKESQFGAFTGILSAVIGFVIGAYMPVSTFPTAIQYVVGFIPGSYSACIFRNIFVTPALDKLPHNAELLAALEDYFSLKVNFCSLDVSYEICFAALIGSVILFGLLTYFLFKYKKTKDSVFRPKKVKAK